MLTGIVYLLHFERPYHGPMQHYVGFTEDLDQRLDSHRNGTACATTRRAFNQGIGFSLARTWWPGSRQLERHIKDCGPVNYCPLCPRGGHVRLSVPGPPPSPDRRRVAEPAGFSQGLPKAAEGALDGFRAARTMAGAGDGKTQSRRQRPPSHGAVWPAGRAGAVDASW